MMKTLTIRSLLIAFFAVAGSAAAFGKDGDRGGDGDSGGSSGDGRGESESGDSGSSGGSGNTSSGDSRSGDSSGGRGGENSGRNDNSRNDDGDDRDQREDRRDDDRENRREDRQERNDQVGPSVGAPQTRLREPQATNLMDLLGLGNSEQNKAREEFKKGKIKKLSEVMAAVDKKYPGEVVSVKLKDDKRTPVYELKILSSDNRLRKIRVDARTLSIY
jgi:uncharacterized membrane protein YkoI